VGADTVGAGEAVSGADRAGRQHQYRPGDGRGWIAEHREDYREDEHSEHYHHPADPQQRTAA
jgi:hypothetical protein